MLYVVYLGKTLWPLDLAIYPADALDNSTWGWAAAGILALLTAGSLWAARNGRRWLAVGWLWYLLVLLPTIRLVQVSPASDVRPRPLPVADRTMHRDCLERGKLGWRTANEIGFLPRGIAPADGARRDGVASGILLEKQRGPLEPRTGLHTTASVRVGRSWFRVDGPRGRLRRDGPLPGGTANRS